MRAWPFIVLPVVLLSIRHARGDDALALARHATRLDAGPLPSNDVRWSATLAPAIDIGSLPRPAPGLALGFDVRRGALAARLRGSGYLAQRTVGGGFVSLFDATALVCALAPIGATIDFGACGGAGIGFLYVSPGGVASSLTTRPQGAAELRLDLFPGRKVFLSTEVGAIVDPLRPQLRPTGFESYRPAAVAFRGTIGIHVRFW